MLGVPLLVARRGASASSTSARSCRASSTTTTSSCSSSRPTAPRSRSTTRGLFEAERARAQRLEHVQAVTDAALAHLELDELLAVLLPRIRDILARRHVRGAAARRGDRTSSSRARRSGSRRRSSRACASRSAAASPVGSRPSGRPVILDDVDHADVLQPDPAREGDQVDARRAAARRRRRRSASSTSARSTPREFTRDDVELLQLVAERVAIAIERARLHEETVQLDQLKRELRRHRLARAADAGDVGLRRPHDARRARARARPRSSARSCSASASSRASACAACSSSCSTSRASTRARSASTRGRSSSAAVLDEIVADARAGSDGVELDVPDDLAVDRRSARARARRVEPARQRGALRRAADPDRRREQRDRHLRISVEDSGAGVPEELAARLFDRFARGDDAARHGLGLAIARAYARRTAATSSTTRASAARASSCSSLSRARDSPPVSTS